MKEESIGRKANKLIKAYELYNSNQNEYLGLLETAARSYCSDVFNKRGNLVPPKNAQIETSGLCKEIVQIVNKMNTSIAKKLIENSEDFKDKPNKSKKSRKTTKGYKYINSSFGRVRMGFGEFPYFGD